MAKNSVQFVCTECGWNGAKWFGRCPECQEWGTIEEFHEARTNSSSSRSSSSLKNPRTHFIVRSRDFIHASNDTSLGQTQRISTGFEEYDRVLGGGIVAGAVILMAGEPGIGKSTLLLETAGNIARQYTHDPNNAHVLYISGEESLSQIHMRAQRIGAIDDNLFLASTTDLDTALSLIEQEKPSVVIVDSAQTIHSAHIDGMSGGSSQVREVASSLITIAKEHNIAILLVGHVTKDGAIAGPRTLEHLVDVVCQFEGDTQTALRLLRSIKNRFGPTDEVGCFDMSGEGIEEVKDPSGLFMSDFDDNTAGTCISFTLDGHRSLPIEIQSLVTNSVLPTPRRASNGIDTNRLAMLVAVLYRHGRMNLLGNDLYVSTIAGGSAKEPACDLAIVLALASANSHTPIPRLTAAIGEISLTGQIRPVPRLNHRIREAARLGFTRIIVPQPRNSVHYETPRSVTLCPVSSLQEVLHILHLNSQ